MAFRLLVAGLRTNVKRMAKRYLNLPFPNSANAARWGTIVSAVERQRYDGYFLDGLMSDTFGTPWNPPTPPTRTYANILPAIREIAATGKELCVVLYCFAPDTNSWSTVAGGSLCSRLIRPGASNIVLLEVRDGSQDFIDAVVAEWLIYGGSLSKLKFQIGRELGIGGGGGPLSTASNHGKYDAFSDSAGTVSSPGYFRTQAALLFGEGWHMNAADCQDMGDALASGDPTRGAEIAELLGVHDVLEFIVPNLNFYGCQVIGPAYEHQIGNAWGSVSAETNIGASTIADRERQSLYKRGYSWPAYIDSIAFDLYMGDQSTMPSLGIRKFGDLLIDMCQEAVSRVRAVSGSDHGAHSLPAWLTEVGFAWKWIVNSGESFDQAARGKYFRTLYDLAPCLPFEVVGLYRWENYSGSEDSTSSSTNFGMCTSAGKASVGIVELENAGGLPTSSSDDPPDGYSWVSGSTAS